MIVFKNPGVVDVAAIVTLGVSVKDEKSIGYFGTGLKFAIAQILREQNSIVIYAGKQKLVFGTVPETIKGQEFDIVTMNGKKLGFTTQLGRDWKTWMSYRELASNCKDEGGKVFTASDNDSDSKYTAEGFTTIIVRGQSFIAAHLNRYQIFINPEMKPIYATDEVEVYSGPSSNIYYRGVCVGQWNSPAKLCYNILTNIELTEDRTYKSYFGLRALISEVISKAVGTKFFEEAITCGNKFVESYFSLLMDGYNEDEISIVTKIVFDSGYPIEKINDYVAKKAYSWQMDRLGTKDSVKLSVRETNILTNTLTKFAKCGIRIEKYPIIVVESVGNGVMGLARDGKIFVSRKAFAKGGREVAAVLFEEFAHLESGAADETRAFQNYFIDCALTLMEELGGEAF